jgi:ubiquinone/menaquinone biosynthesis C-methylase UbiE
MKILQTAERVSHKDVSDNYVFQRSLLAYVKASEIVFGDVLEIGTGSGYGIEKIAPHTNRFVTIDKYKTDVLSDTNINNVEFIKMNVPPLSNIPDNSFDFVITFQVIEHIKKDNEFVKEIYRVLKNKGKLIVTTPNKKMSLTRNPWHIREYTINELENLLLNHFGSVEKLGVFGNDKILKYYNANKKSVEKITRFDIFNLQHILPRQLLQIPYDILNRLNRKKLLNDNTSLVSKISMNDYYIDKAKDECFDLFYIAEKSTESQNK